MRSIGVEAVGGERGGGAEPGAPRGRDGARAHPLFLCAAEHQRFEVDAVADPQRANPLWTVNLVRRQGEIGRASCRDKVCQVVYISVGAGSLKKTINKSPNQKS